MISIIIPARNEEDNLGNLLESIERNSYEDYEIIVVDGNSKDRTKEIAREHGAEVIEGPGSGLAAAQNLGWKNAEGEIIWFIDADCTLGPNALRDANEFFEKNAEKDLAGLDVRHRPKTLVEKAVSAENRANAMRGKIFRAIREAGQKLGVLE